MNLCKITEKRETDLLMIRFRHINKAMIRILEIYAPAASACEKITQMCCVHLIAALRIKEERHRTISNANVIEMTKHLNMQKQLSALNYFD